MELRNIEESDWPAVREIYLQGIATGQATFQTEAPSWEEWDRSHIQHSRFLAVIGKNVVGWAALSPVSGRCVYAGVAEVSVYIHEDYRGRGVGSFLMEALIRSSEEQGVWTLQSGIFPENEASIRLHEKHDFRILGYREKVGKHGDLWRDTVLMERRSKTVGIDRKIEMKKILVLCTGNSCRSQLAEGYLRHFAQGKAEVYSAGIETHGVNPKAIQVMKEDGIDISHHTSNHVDEYSDVDFDYVITVCDNAKESCPFFPTKAQKFHQNFPDPAKATGTPEEVLNEFRAVRDLVKEYMNNFVEEHINGEAYVSN